MFESTRKCKVDKALNGFEAFQSVMVKFNDNPQELYDVIVLDLNMPISDGFEACTKILNLFNQQKMFSNSECILQPDSRVERSNSVVSI